MNLPKQQSVTTLKQFWMRVSFRDAVKLGFGFAIGASVASFIIGFLWFVFAFMLGFMAHTSGISM
jgi:hypothetical protein